MRFYVYGGAPPPSFALGFRVPPPSFDHFWWVKVGLYDKKNQEASRFWRNADLTNRQSECLLFGSGSTSGVLDDVDDEVAIDFIFGRGLLSLDVEGELKVPKPESLILISETIGVCIA